ncbi:LOB domain-containing protein 38-like [Lotus japonicus]|uniref:LOB domain-containing protein n=1 Tax=Lotus japonicus TaxID=34305 RepID=I3T344_LOTJA|nr:LOB domain-containing protein 38-like [Lotus japonicus]AFK46936.1 unknown [Lotus japonicus]
MSCNGCRVLRKGCSGDDCMLRHCLRWIESPQAQANATVFVAKFFGRATLMSFLSSVPTNQRSALFESLLYEAVGRALNPVSGAVGLLWSGNWQLCQSGVEKVLQGGGALTPLPQFSGVDHESSEGFESFIAGSSPSRKLKINHEAESSGLVVGGGGGRCHQAKKQRVRTPSEESEGSTLGNRGEDCGSDSERKLLPLFF